MKLLFEEFFIKIHKISETHFLLKIIIKLIIFIIILGGLILIVFLILTKKYFLLFILSGIIILAEVAHYVRKLREKKLKAACQIKLRGHAKISAS